MKFHKPLRLFLIVTTLVTGLFACSSSNFSSPTLANQGILALSTRNAYLGSNLFIAKQAENSPLFYSFLKGRGGPMAMELLDENFSAPRLLLYYPRDREVYAAEVEKRDKTYEWIVRGPFNIKREDFTTMARMQSAMNGEPVFNIYGREQRFRFEQRQPIITPIPTAIPTPLPTKVATPKKKKPTPVIKVEGSATPSVSEFRPLNSDQQAIQMAKGFAERADNGDIIHTVKSDGDTIEAVAKWYTGSVAAAAQIAATNGVEVGKPLANGTRIRVPMKSLKNLKVMPAGYK